MNGDPRVNNLDALRAQLADAIVRASLDANALYGETGPDDLEAAEACRDMLVSAIVPVVTSWTSYFMTVGALVGANIKANPSASNEDIAMAAMARMDLMHQHAPGASCDGCPEDAE